MKAFFLLILKPEKFNADKTPFKNHIKILSIWKPPKQIFTALQPFTIGIFDRTFSRDVMYKYPVLYGCTQHCDDFNTYVFWQMAGGALLHSFILFFLPTIVLEKGLFALFNNNWHRYIQTPSCFNSTDWCNCFYIFLLKIILFVRQLFEVAHKLLQIKISFLTTY